MIKLKTLVLVITLSLLAACKGTEAATSQPSGSAFVNTTCPIAGEAIDPEFEGVSYNGYAIGFCCGGCVSKWDAWTDAKKAEFVSMAMKG